MDDTSGLATIRRALSAQSPMAFPEGITPPSDYLDTVDRDPTWAAIGDDLLRSGRVVVLTLAGGRSTRYGGRFRGDVPVGPVTGRTLFELHGQRIGALRCRKAPGLRWLIMVSPATEGPVRAALRRAAWFGIPPRDVWLFQQPLFPVVDEYLELARDRTGTPIRTPGGHGALLGALREAGLLARLAALRIEHIYAFHYPNVLESICDPAMLGWHQARGYDATAKGVREVRQGEAAGRLAVAPAQVIVLEYHYLTTPARQDAVAGCPLWTGGIVWSVPFLRRCAENVDTLPYHAVTHAEPGDERRLWRVEQFVFDLLAHSRSTGVVIGPRQREYAVIKTPDGPESADAARAALSTMYRQWLAEAGALPQGYVGQVEIDAGYALSSEELAARLPDGFRYTDGLVLSETA